MGYKGIATLLFGKIVDKNRESFLPVKNSLLSANIKMPLRTYVSVAILATITAYFAALATIIVLVNVLGLIAVEGLLIFTYYMFVPLFVAIVTFLAMMIYPSQIVITRTRNIETNLPFVLTHMGAVAESGVPPYVIFKLISKFEDYGDIAIEMKKIVRSIDDFGVDPITAVKEVAERTPSSSLKQILLGFVTTVESGGDIKLFLKSAGGQSLFEWRIRRERFLQQLSAYAEFYTGLLIAAPLFIIALFAVMNMIQPNLAGFNILDLTKLSIYLLVPSLNIGFLIFLRGVEVEI